MPDLQIVLLSKYLLCSCAAIVDAGREALQHIKAVTNLKRGPNGKKRFGHK